MYGQSKDAPGPGAYTASPGAFSTSKSPSSAFASRSTQHASNPSDGNVAVGPAVGAYDIRTYDKHARRSFTSDAVLGVKTPGGFGSAVPRGTAAKEPGTATPGPGQYNTTGNGSPQSLQKPSSVFASASQQRGPNPVPSYAPDSVYVPSGMGAGRTTGKPNMGFGGASRGLAMDEQAEVAALREMLGKA